MSAPTIKLKIRTVKSAVCDIEIATDKTILDVKKAIEAQYNHPVDWQRLIFSGKVLEDAQTVAEYNIQADKMVILYIKDPATAKPTAAAATTPAAATTTPATPAQPTATATPTAPSRPVGEPAATPASPTAPARAASGPTNNTTLSDEEFSAAVQNLVDMAFDRADAVRALNAAYGDSARAVEYILSGNIPNINNGPRAAPAAAAAGAAPAVTGSGEFDMAGAFAHLRQSPQFQILIAIVQQNPAMLEPLLQQVAQRDPEIVRLIHENRDEFLQLLQEPVDPAVLQQLSAETEGLEEGMEEDEEFDEAAGIPAGGVPPGQTVISITPAEKEAIDRLVALGFDRNRALEAFLVCNRDEEMAANYLFEQEE